MAVVRSFCSSVQTLTNKGGSTPALFSPVELNPGAFTLLVRFVWVGVNTSLKLWCGPNSPLPGSVVVFKADLG